MHVHFVCMKFEVVCKSKFTEFKNLNFMIFILRFMHSAVVLHIKFGIGMGRTDLIFHCVVVGFMFLGYLESSTNKSKHVSGSERSAHIQRGQ
jgi:hypothetical protein